MEPWVDTNLGVPGDPDEWVHSASILCSNGCGLDIGVKDGRIVGVRGRADHPVNFGHLGPKATRPGREVFTPFHFGHGDQAANQYTWCARNAVSKQPQLKSSPAAPPELRRAAAVAARPTQGPHGEALEPFAAHSAEPSIAPPSSGSSDAH